MKYEFTLKVKYHNSDIWNKIARSVVKEVDYNNALKDFNKYADRGSYCDTLILINKLDDEGNFLEVVQ